MHKRNRRGEIDEVPQREEEAEGKTEEERETKEGDKRGKTQRERITGDRGKTQWKT
jgi:hypothetical protein